MKKRLLITILLCSVIGLTACGDKHDKPTYNASNYPINSFNKDNNTVSVVNQNNFLTDQEIAEINAQSALNTNEEFDYEYTEPDGGELVLENEDTTTDYEIQEDGSITYKEKTFHGLYNAMQSIEIPYDENTFINFLIKTINAEDTYINVYRQTDELEEFDVSMFEFYKGNSTYNSMIDKYNTEPEWCLDIGLVDGDSVSKHTYIYGCSAYVFLLDADNDIVIDMSEYDSTPSTVTEEGDN